MKLTTNQKYLACGLGGLVLGFFGYTAWQKAQVKKATATTPGHTSNFAGGGKGRMVVGGYNAQTNKTWVFPEGNTAGGHWVNGSVNLPQGTYYTTYE